MNENDFLSIEEQRSPVMTLLSKGPFLHSVSGMCCVSVRVSALLSYHKLSLKEGQKVILTMGAALCEQLKDITKGQKFFLHKDKNRSRYGLTVIENDERLQATKI